MSGKMTKEDSSRIQSSQALGGKDMSSSGFASRAQSAGDKNTNTGGTSSGYGSGNQSGGQGQGKKN